MSDITTCIMKMYSDWVSYAIKCFEKNKSSTKFWPLMPVEDFQYQLNCVGTDCLPKEGDFKNPWPESSDLSQSSETELLSERSSEKNEWTNLI